MTIRFLLLWLIMRRGRKIKHSILSLAVALLCLGAYYLQSHPEVRNSNGSAEVLGVQAPGYYRVTRVTDGDTIEVDMNGVTEKIRLIGVDTPESVKQNSPVQCYGHEASDYSKQNLSGASVKLEADPIGDNRDRYDRLLRYVYLRDGTLWNQKLISEGYGFAYLSFEFSKQDEFAAAQSKAQESKLRLWSDCTPKLGSSGRWQSNNLR